MKLAFLAIGKPHESYVLEGVNDFTRRIANYFPAEWKILPPPRHAASLTADELKKKEAALVMQHIRDDDYFICLDENGKHFSSVEFSSFLGQRANEGRRHLLFLIGGAYGLDSRLLQRADMTWSLSRLTFPHQLVRLILCEQIYRGCTIMRNEKYHHK